MADLICFIPSSGAAPHDCAYSDYWTNTSGAAHLPLLTTKGSSAIAVRDPQYVRYDTNCLGWQGVSPAMPARDWTPADTFDIAIICRDANAPTTTWKLHVSIRIFNAAGDTEVGVLFEGEVNPTAFSGSWQNRHADGVAMQNSVSMPENGHLVVEIGAAATYEASSYNANIVVGDAPSTPLPLDDTDNNVDTKYPWIAFTYGVAEEPISDAGAIASAEAFGTPKMVGTILAAGAIASAAAVGSPILQGTVQGLTGIATAEALGEPALVGKLKPGAIASIEAIGTALLRGAVQGITGIASTEALGVPALLQIIQAAGGIASAEALGAAILRGTINPGGIASAEAFGTAEVAEPAATIIQEAGGILSAEAIGEPKLKGTVLAAGGIASGEVVPDGHRVSAVLPGVLQLGGIVSAEAMGTPALRASIKEVGDISSAEAFGAAKLMGIIRAGGILSAEAVGVPSIRGTIHPSGIPSKEALGIPDLVAIIRAGGIATLEAFGDLQLNGQIRVTGIPSEEGLGTPRVRDLTIPVGVIVAQGIASAEAFGHGVLVDLDKPSAPCGSWAMRGRCLEPRGTKVVYRGAKCPPVGPKPRRCG